MGSSSQKLFDDWRMILDTSSLETEENKLKMVGVCLGAVWGEENVEEDFSAVCSLRILSEKKVANICESDLGEGTDGRGEVDLR